MEKADLVSCWKFALSRGVRGEGVRCGAARVSEGGD